MCARYRLASDWQNFPVLKPADFSGNADARPTNIMPIVRLVDGRWQAEMRHWGFLRAWPGPSGKIVKHQLFNAVGEELSQKRAFKKAFASQRCLVPMSAWYEWPLVAGSKTKTEIGMKNHATFAAAGLYETSTNPDNGEPIETYTIVTGPPNVTLAKVHERAPLVLKADDCANWLEGDRVLAQALIGAFDDEDAFYVQPAAPQQAGLF